MSGLHLQTRARNGVSRCTHSFVLGALFAHVLAACSGGEGAPPLANPPPANLGSTPSVPTGNRGYGPYFYGGVQIEGREHFGVALLTADGTLRIHVADATQAAQFVGRVRVQPRGLTGTGAIIGQSCANPGPNPYCGKTSTGVIAGTFVPSGLQAEVHVTREGGNEVWLLNFGTHNLFMNPVSMETLSGQYRELLAEFARDGDTIVNIDSTGQLFFQSPSSGCVGNGTLARRPDGSFNLYDVTLTIGDCNSVYAHLNGEFQGIASPAADGWDYGGFLLQILLSSPEEAASQMAITMSGRTEF
jgi:hypothetical protein